MRVCVNGRLRISEAFLFPESVVLGKKVVSLLGEGAEAALICSPSHNFP